MRSSTRTIRALVASALAATALLAVGAGQAIAAPSWSTATGYVHGKGSVTLKLNGTDPVVCPAVTIKATAAAHWLFAYPNMYETPMFMGKCNVSKSHPSDQISMKIVAQASYQSGAYWVLGQGGLIWQQSPYGQFESAAFHAELKNPAGGQPAQLILNAPNLGVVRNSFGLVGILSATGTFALEDSKGGNVSLQGQ